MPPTRRSIAGITMVRLMRSLHQRSVVLKLFTGQAGCAQCHHIGEHSALFTDQRFHNTGIGWYHSMKNRYRSAKSN